jgi:hypothetical protein
VAITCNLRGIFLASLCKLKSSNSGTEDLMNLIFPRVFMPLLDWNTGESDLEPEAAAWAHPSLESTSLQFEHGELTLTTMLL